MKMPDPFLGLFGGVQILLMGKIVLGAAALILLYVGSNRVEEVFLFLKLVQ